MFDADTELENNLKVPSGFPAINKWSHGGVKIMDFRTSRHSKMPRDVVNAFLVHQKYIEQNIEKSLGATNIWHLHLIT